MIKAVSLDVEDTLNNLSKGTQAAVEYMCNYLSEKTGIPYETILERYQEVRAWAKQKYPNDVRFYDIATRLDHLSKNGMPEITPYVKDVSNRFYQLERDNAVLFPDKVSYFIDQLLGRYLVGITSDSRHILEPNHSSNLEPNWLERIGVDTSVLDFVVNIEMSGKKTKRTGYPYDLLIKELEPLGVQPNEIVHIGDSEKSDIIPAVEKGMNAILFDPTKSSFNDLFDAIIDLNWVLSFSSN